MNIRTCASGKTPTFAAEFFVHRSAFRFAVRHAQATRMANDVLTIRISGVSPLEDGRAESGIGESLTRAYVTGENVSITVAAEIFRQLAVPVMASAADLSRAISLLLDANEQASVRGAIALWSGFDIALVDWLSRIHRLPVSQLIKQIEASACARTGMTMTVASVPIESSARVVVRATIPMLKPWQAGLLARLYRLAGFRHLKVKVGDGDSLSRIHSVACTMPADLTLDANRAYAPEHALHLISAYRDFPDFSSTNQPAIVAFEDPVSTLTGPAAVELMEDFAGKSMIPVMVDEPLSDIFSCRDFAQSRKIRFWNLRVGKCGGITGTIMAATLARANGIDVVMGALVGEGAPLTRAARLLLPVVRPVWADAAFSGWILRGSVYAAWLKWPGRVAGFGLRLRESSIRRSMLAYGAMRCIASAKASLDPPHDMRTLRDPAGPKGSPGIMTTRAFARLDEANS
ncbi:MAG: L-Ala-D/L-Glu epimerase [Pseudomonadota bacterium]|jgi:L-alanine-DL-glutamate epimerase-like enolase superfamily enzyme